VSQQTTLPLINAAASYAMYMISSHLGIDLDIRPIAVNFPGEDNFSSSELNCNAILLCDVNPALKQLVKFDEIDTKTKIEPNMDDLPCWFVEYETGTTYRRSLKINVYDSIK